MLTLDLTLTDQMLQPLSWMPSPAEWRALYRWVRHQRPHDPERGRPRDPLWGADPEWVRIPVETLTGPRWTFTWDPEAGIVGTRWLPVPRQRPHHRYWQVVVGPPDWTGVWTVRLASQHAPYSVWGLWWPDWHRVMPVVLTDRADPDPYGPHPPLVEGRIVAPPDQSARWAAFLHERGWVTPEEWRYWTASTDRLTAMTHWPLVLW